MGPAKFTNHYLQTNLEMYVTPGQVHEDFWRAKGHLSTTCRAELCVWEMLTDQIRPEITENQLWLMMIYWP